MKNQYEVGEVYEIFGKKRKVLAVEPELVTSTNLDYEEPKDELAEAKSEAESILKKAEKEAEVLKARASAPDYGKMLAFIPLDKCGKEQLTGIAKLVGAEIIPGMSSSELSAAIKK